MLKRNLHVFLIFIAIIIVTLFLDCFDIYHTKNIFVKVNNESVLTGVLTFSTLTTAFLFFSFSIVPLLIATSNLYKDFGFDIKYAERLILYIFLFLWLSILTLLLMTFSWNIIIKYLFVTWISLFITSTVSILLLIIFLLSTVNKKIKEKTNKV